MPLYYEQDESKKPEMKKKFNEETLSPLIKNMMKALEKNGGKYLVGDSVTIADFALVNILFNLVHYTGDWKPEHPEAEKYMNEILSLPKIKTWVEKRPKSDN